MRAIAETTVLKSKGKIKRRSAQERARLLKQWEESGMSRPDFARKHRINYGTFASWFRKGDNGLGQKENALAEPSSVLQEVNLGALTLRESIGVKLALSCGISVEFSVDKVDSLVDAVVKLERCLRC